MCESPTEGQNQSNDLSSCFRGGPKICVRNTKWKKILFSIKLK